MRLLTRVRQESEGFTLIEAMVSLVIIFGLMVVLLRTFDSGTRVIVETRRQAAASAFASELIERAQALEWQHMGLATSTNGASCATEQVGCYVGDPFTGLVANGTGTGYLFENEEVVFSNSDTFRPFLNFHDEVDRDTSTFDRYLFVTSIPSATDPTVEVARRITAIVTWIAPSGFPKEIHLQTIVSEYREPSQPLIQGSAKLAGGSLSFVNAGSLANGTEWGVFEETVLGSGEFQPNSLTPREIFRGSIDFPLIALASTRDFVSSTSLRASGTDISLFEWSGPDRLMDTADDVFIQREPVELLLLTDDDASSLPPLNIDDSSVPAVGNFLNETMAGFLELGGGSRDIVVGELAGNPSTYTADSYSFTGHLWTQHLQGPTAIQLDELPFAQIASSTTVPERILVGFREYNEIGLDDARVLYGSGPAIGHSANPLELPFYEFDLFKRGANGGQAFAFDATSDQVFDELAGARRIELAADYSGGVLYFLDDDAYRGAGTGAGKSAQFEGWIRITMPDITVTPVTAGELTATVTASSVSATDVVVEQWDPTTDTYVVVDDLGGSSPIDYSAMGVDCSDPRATKTIPLWGGVAQTAQIPDLSGPINSYKNPFLDYVVEATVTVNGWCWAEQVDTFGNRSESRIQTDGPIVEVDVVDYTVTDFLFNWAGLR